MNILVMGYAVARAQREQQYIIYMLKEEENFKAKREIQRKIQSEIQREEYCPCGDCFIIRPPCRCVKTRKEEEPKNREEEEPKNREEEPKNKLSKIISKIKKYF
jgi:hypothetical protein